MTNEVVFVKTLRKLLFCSLSNENYVKIHVPGEKANKKRKKHLEMCGNFLQFSVKESRCSEILERLEELKSNMVNHSVEDTGEEHEADSGRVLLPVTHSFMRTLVKISTVWTRKMAMKNCHTIYEWMLEQYKVCFKSFNTENTRKKSNNFSMH